MAPVRKWVTGSMGFRIARCGKGGSGAEVVEDGKGGEEYEYEGERYGGDEADALKADGSEDAAGEEEGDEGGEEREPGAVGLDVRGLEAIGGAIPVEEFTEFDADVGDHAGDVGGADDGVGELGDDGVLEAHGEGEEHDDGGDEEPVSEFEVSAEETEAEQENGFEDEREGVLTLELAAPSPIDEDGGEGGSGGEGEDGTEAGEDDGEIADGEMGGHGGDHAGHVGGVLVDGEVASSVDGSGDEGEDEGEMAVSGVGSVGPGESAEIQKGHVAVSMVVLGCVGAGIAYAGRMVNLPRNEGEIDAFVGAFEGCTLPKEQWTHGAHLLTGAWYVHRYGADDALERMRRNVRAYNVSVGGKNTETSGYHETITVFWIKLLAGLRLEVQEMARAEFAGLAVERFAEDKGILGRYYDFDVLQSVEARREWVAPTLARLD